MLDHQRPQIMPLGEAERIRERACLRKVSMGLNAARGSAEIVNAGQQDRVVVYRCPFGCGGFHIGHLMSMESVEQMAMAIRILAQQ